MPHATASWLVDNSSLTFEQIAEFCGLHILEVQAIADDTAATKLTGRDPIRAGELNQEEIDTHELFDQVVARHAHDCKVRRIVVDTQVGAGAELLEVDPFRMEQAIENIVVNALRHTPVGSHISLRASREDERVVIEVSDSGEGISSEHLPHIFDRFYKASSTNGLASPGSGLGLSIVKAIVIRHGGNISASSEPGRGTTIRIEVPSPSLVSDADALALP